MQIDSRVTPHPSVQPPTPTLSDLAKARAFLAAWGYGPEACVRPSVAYDEERALAQAFADEREGAEERVGLLSDACRSNDRAVSLVEAELARERAGAVAYEESEAVRRQQWEKAARRAAAPLLRRAVGVLSDLRRLVPEIDAVLDAEGGVPACGLDGVEAWCSLRRGHRGPCGAVGQTPKDER